MANKRRDPQREAWWQELVAKQAESGLNVRDFCWHEQLTELAFYCWRRTLDKRDELSAPPAKSRLARGESPQP